MITHTQFKIISALFYVIKMNEKKKPLRGHIYTSVAAPFASQSEVILVAYSPWVTLGEGKNK